ncbi:hypothetical protein MNBD_NITROSPINAE03-978 [hydrothermal vent metagenome]|uniref:OmpA-like domain-containing protein n=1 Tax=hydrothermal vent metagenome TaxID=652676 RepID=A0A3B1CM60_9ZZZZ
MLQGKHLLTALFAATFIFAASFAHAQTGVDGGTGLFFVDKAKTLGHKNYSISGFYSDLNYETAKVNTDQTILSIPFTLGISDNLEVSAVYRSVNIDPEGFQSVDGPADGLGKLKWNFLNSEKYRIRLAAIGLVTLPFGSENKGLGTGDTDLGVKLALDKEYDNITWHFNVGFLDHKAENLDSVFLYGAGFEWFATPNLSLIGEVRGRSWSDQVPMRDDNTTAGGGIRYYVGDWASVSAGYNSWGGGTGERSPNAMWTIGVTFGRGLGQPRPASRIEPIAEEEKPAEPEAPAAPAPAPTPAPEPAPEPEVITIVLEGVHFKFDKSDLTDEAKEILQRNAEKLKANPDVKVVVEGYTCSIGSKGYNYKLGLRRAKSAKLYLVKQMGVHPDSMFVITSFGEERPAHTNKTRAGRALNRRVDFVIQSR